MKRHIKCLLFVILISLFIEICFFNFDSIISNFYNKYPNNVNVYYENNFINSNGAYILNEAENYSTIEIYDINSEINNIYIDFEINGEKNCVKTSYYISDEGCGDLYSSEYSDGAVWDQNILSSRYVNINPYGNVNRILIKIYKDSIETLKINEIKLNQVKPILFSSFRFMLILFIVAFIYFLIIDAKVYTFTFSNTKATIKNLLLVGLIIIQLITSLSISKINKYLVNDYENEQYQNLTDSLMESRFNLNYNVDKKLESLNNPYDLSERLNSNCEYQFDTAYYKGNYYCYFGIAPVITFYLPYKLLTGNFIKDYAINAISFIILSLAIIFLFNKLVNKYFKDMPLVVFAIMTIFTIDTCGALTLLSEPRIYTVPVLYGLAFSIAAISLWTNSVLDNNKLNNREVLLGSICMGLAIASRPQFALVSVFAFVIFNNQIKDLKNNIASFIIAISPLLIIGSLLMYYNYARFGSPFDFGANYNLTFNDMTRRGFKLDRINDGLFYYLLQLPNIQPIFPFVNVVEFSSTYIGMLIQEYSFGGLFAINPITILSILSIKAKTIIKENKLRISSLLLFISGITIVLVDTQMSGLVERYFSDFSIFFILSSLIVCISYIENSENNKVKKYKIFIVLLSIAIIFSVLRIFANSYMSLSICNPSLYNKIYSLFN